MRDPIHNLIHFGSNNFERILWEVVQKPEFQRLRRIRQLGFSEFVYPGATHTRYAHSIGTFHTARQLMRIIEKCIEVRGDIFEENKAQTALAASLVHDVGHGMFSHAFEEVGKGLGLKVIRHETVSTELIKNSGISEALNSLHSGFANDVAAVIGASGAGNLYNAVVSSQFDADRLDYMQRDRLMTGVQNSGIDFTWLLNNLEIGSVPSGVDDQKTDEVETFVLGSKAVYAAETYILGLFQLYPTVYFHKATRGAEKLFSRVLERILKLVLDGSTVNTGLPSEHPLVKYAKKPDDIEVLLSLDDSVFWGALSLLQGSKDVLISSYSKRLANRELLKCKDIHQDVIRAIQAKSELVEKFATDPDRLLKRISDLVEEKIDERIEEGDGKLPTILKDKDRREPYRRFDESKGPLNQIRIHRAEKDIVDIADLSPVIRNLKPFDLFRIYYDRNDSDTPAWAGKVIQSAIEEGLRDVSE